MDGQTVANVLDAIREQRREFDLDISRLRNQYNNLARQYSALEKRTSVLEGQLAEERATVDNLLAVLVDAGLITLPETPVVTEQAQEVI